MDYSSLSIPFHFLQKQLLEEFVKSKECQQELHYFIPYLTIISNGMKKFSIEEMCPESIKGDDVLVLNNCCQFYGRIRDLVKNEKVKQKIPISKEEMEEMATDEDRSIFQTYNTLLRLINEMDYSAFEDDLNALFPCQNIGITTVISFSKFRIFDISEIIVHMCLKLKTADFASLVMLNSVQDYDSILNTILQQSNYKTLYGDLNRERVFRNMILLKPSKVKYFKELDINSINLSIFINIICSLDDSHFMDLLNYLLKTANEDTIKAMKYISNPYVGQVSEKFDNILVHHIVTDTYSMDILKTMTHLLSTLGIRFRGEDSKRWITYLTRTTGVDEKFFKIHLAIIISWAYIFMPPNSTSDVNQPPIKEFCAFLKELTENVERITCNSLSQYMILLSILFDRNDYNTLKHTTEKVLEFDINIKTSKLDVMKDIYQQHCLSINDVLQRIDKLEVTENLSSMTEGFLPIHCINYLLNLGKLTDYLPKVSEWIEKQIVTSKLPVAESLIHLILEYTKAIFISDDKDYTGKILPFHFIKEAFTGKVIDESKLLVRSLCLLYLLSFKVNLLKSSSCSSDAERRSPYPEDFIDQIPKTYIATVVDLRRDDFSGLYGKLVSYMNVVYTYDVPHSEIKLDDIQIEDDEECPMVVGVEGNSNELSKEQIKSLKCLNVIELSSFSSSIVLALTRSLNDVELYDEECLGLLSNYWFTISRLFPERITGLTVKSWCQDDGFTEKDIAQNPLRIFRCHERVLHSSKHFIVLIELIEYYLQKYTTHISMNINRMKLIPKTVLKDIDEKQRMRDITLDTVQVTIIQILLDCCLENEKNKRDLEEIRKLVCQYMHKKFLQTCNLITFVHFQTYHRSLIEMVVKNVPSVHVMRTKTNEMFAVAELKKKIFAILLLIELTVQYDLPSSYVHSHFVLDFLMSMRRHLSTIDYINTLRIVLPSIPKLLTTYPQDILKLHVEQVFSLAREISKIHAATHSSLYSMQQSPGYKLMKMIDEIMYKNNLKLYDFTNSNRKPIYGP
uniref:Integrator complex subunit 2 (inferred by orthology to a human protein) n=1 Tax=Strongyloides venezuelensis TaxID=75913 RepID=A0A0K0EW05_STRVS